MDGHIVDLGSDADESTEMMEEADGSGINDERGFTVQLWECLDEVKHEGTYATYGSHKQYINPGLHIKDLGTIGLPLSTRDATAIAGRCRKSPFGKGDETIIDESVRKTWELDTTEFGCGNPDWQAFVDALLQQVIQDLGVQVEARAEPYKLLLYEQGAHFKAHRDTEKVPGMFGTLVVCLPSLHQGGSVHLSHGRKQQTINTANSSAFSMQVLAWYSDVQHEILPIESGYRLVLTYNLVQDQNLPMQTAAALDASHNRLTTLLQIWNKNYHYINYLVYPLEHKYSESSLSLRNLKGQDAAKGRYLDHLCAKNGFYWFLTQMTKEEQEEDYYGNREDEEKVLTFGKTMLPSGRHVYIELYKPKEKYILADSEDMYDGRSPDSEDEGEYTGNENMPATHRYHNAVVILMRKRELLNRFWEHKKHSAEALLHFFDMIREDRACETGIRREALQLILKKALVIAKSNEDDQDKLWDVLGYGKDERDRNRKKFSKRPHSPTYASANEQRTTFEDIRKVLPSASTDSFDKWRKDRIEADVRAAQDFGLNDGQAVVDLIPHVSPQIYFENIIPLLMRQPERRALSRFMHILATDDTVSQDTIVKPTYERLAETAVASLKLSATDITESEPEPSPYNTHNGGFPVRQIIQIGIYAVELLKIIDQYMKLGLKREAVQLLGANLPDLPAATDSRWTKWKYWFIFVDSLRDMLTLHLDDELTGQCKAFISSALHSCAGHIAQSRPRQPKDWVRIVKTPYPTCTCEACRDLNTFLNSKTQRVGRFSYAERLRKHLSYRLNADFYTDTEKTRSPYTLVVTKTNNEYKRLLDQWKAQVREIRNQLGVMQGSFEPLGINVTEAADLDAQLVSANAAEGVVSSTRPLQPALASAQNIAAPKQVAGAKRKSDVIDLTEN